MPSYVHEEALIHLVSTFHAAFPDYLGSSPDSPSIKIYGNVTIRGTMITGVPDLMVELFHPCSPPSLPALKRCFTLECAFTESKERAIEKLALYIKSFPELIAVAVLDIREAQFSSPSDQAFPERLSGAEPRSLKSFLSSASKKGSFSKLRPIRHARIDWINITSVEFHVWER